MRTKFTLLILFLIGNMTYGQDVLSSGGDSFDTGDVILQFTLGELATETVGSSTVLTQGFHQTFLTDVSIEEFQSLSYTIYPNPTSDWIQIEIPNQNGKMEIVMTDMAGRIVGLFQIDNSALEPIDIRHLHSGTYMIHIKVDGKTQIQNSKLIQIL